MPVPHVDMATGAIYGCEEGSFKWYHEKGHLEFDKLFGSWLLFTQYARTLLLLSLSLSFIIKFFININLLLIFYLFVSFIYEEWWCNQYAKQQLNLKQSIDSK